MGILGKMNLSTFRFFLVGFTILVLVLTAVQLIFLRKQINTRLKAMTVKPVKTSTNAPSNSSALHDISAIISSSLHNRVNKTSSANFVDKCPEESPLLQGNLSVSFEARQNYSGNWPPTLRDIALDNPDLELGGYNPGPRNCKARNSIAVIVPYRDRQEHLRYFLHYIHLILQRQQTCYVIYVVEQDDDHTFNKGQLMNAAFLYVTNNSTLNISCFFFHDVDTISEDDRTLYRCRDGNEVVHLAMRVDRFKYKFCCGMTVGGVLGFTKKQFNAINGFSNAYFGWGAEDDDANYRIRNVGKMNLFRPPEQFKRFKLIPHKRDEKNQPNSKRLELLKAWRSRQPHDGINSLDSPISKIIKYPTHTRLYVKVKPQS